VVHIIHRSRYFLSFSSDWNDRWKRNCLTTRTTTLIWVAGE